MASLVKARANNAFGLASKKLAAMPNAGFSRAARYVLDCANVAPVPPALLFCRFVTNAALAKPLVLKFVRPLKNFVNIGKVTWPGNPQLAKLLAVCCAAVAPATP